MRFHKKSALAQRVRSWSLTVLLISAALSQPCALLAEPVAVRHMEGTVRGFLVLRTREGKTLASGDLSQVVQGDRLVSHLVYRFTKSYPLWPEAKASNFFQR